MLAGLGTMEIVIILAIAGLVFGPALLPVIGRRIGGALRGAKDVTKEFNKALNDATDEK